MVSGPGDGIVAFCCVTRFERYPEGACASMAMRDLAHLVSLRRPRSVTNKIPTRRALEEIAVAVLREEPDDKMNLNPDGFIPSWIATRRGADKAKSYNSRRVEAEGPAPVMALAAERAYILARAGGTLLGPFRDRRGPGGYASLPADSAAAMASSILRELPAEALELVAGMLGSGPDAKDTLALLGGPQAAEAHDRVFGPQIGSGNPR